jgi:hypothetical protein
MFAGSGPSSPESFASYDLDGYSSKTSPAFSLPAEARPEDAYAAGLLDGEGSLTITRKDRWYSPRIEVGMTERALPVLASMQKQYGGSLSKSRDATEHWEAAWRWVITGKLAMACLHRTAPFLRLKVAQASVLLELEKVSSSSEEAASLKAAINALNQKGPARRAVGRWITTQQTLMGEWEAFSGPWPPSGMTRNGTASQLVPLVPRTSATASGSWPTPKESARNSRRALTQQHFSGLALEQAVEVRAGILPREFETWDEMPPSAKQMWHTPTASDRDGKPKWDHRASPGHVRKVPVPNLMAQVLERDLQETGGSLNPTWVEWLMGFPLGWTDLGPSATPSCRKSSSSSAGASSKRKR